ncbi:phosphoglycerate kinase family protein [Candidatus Endolissoclinum faulkneri L2]|uniref:Phosphoglycerate kinase n=1 Tax=Candidatus Endolissoclinum faulkneri L2 TaxID=1193729 RepID=K7YSZ3_9PROT|nr:phosphoglycerate kinase [Candidatus Endolissoclinum faulkneri]AFX99709.1 phosphoglycerate kinase family protein [Candidatus Endolissoclinum faulkneri L2]
MSNYRTLDNITVKGKRVLLRLDLNIPMNNGIVKDTNRLKRSAPTVIELSNKGAKIIIISHYGRPKKKPDAKLSMQPIVEPLAKASGRKINFVHNCIGAVAENAVANLLEGEIVLLENLRFHNGEQTNDINFASSLAKLADIYVNDAFSASHRAHASIKGVADILPAFAGRLMEAELNALNYTLQGPVIAVIGGDKVSTKLNILINLVSQVEVLAIGGCMANTFLFANGVGIGKSLVEPNFIDTVYDIQAKAKEANCDILLSIDAIVADALVADVKTKTVDILKVPSNKMILDIGPKTLELITKRIEACKTLVWNGPLGAFEMKPFDKNTIALAKTVADMTDRGQIISIAGGGNTMAALAEAGVIDRFSYVSTAGGAFLEQLEGKDLPGITALKIN